MFGNIILLFITIINNNKKTALTGRISDAKIKIQAARRAKIEENKAKPRKKSSFQERLEQIQKEQAAKTKEIKANKKKRK